jgi:hypothetical protein
VKIQFKENLIYCLVILGNVTNNLWVLDLITIYWILPVITTIIHFTNLHHINHRLVFWFVITSLLPVSRLSASVLTVCRLSQLLLCESVSASDLIFLTAPIYSSRVESSRVVSNIKTNRPSASHTWNKAPKCGLRSDFYYSQTDAGLLISGTLPDVRTGLSFSIAACSRQLSHSRVRVPLDSRSYFTLSDSRLPFSSPSMTKTEVTVPICVCISLRESFANRVENTLSNSSIFCFPIHRPLAYSLPREPHC